jgi:hypothetical protein
MSRELGREQGRDEYCETKSLAVGRNGIPSYLIPNLVGLRVPRSRNST